MIYSAFTGILNRLNTLLYFQIYFTACSQNAELSSSLSEDHINGNANVPKKLAIHQAISNAI